MNSTAFSLCEKFSKISEGFNLLGQNFRETFVEIVTKRSVPQH